MQSQKYALQFFVVGFFACIALIMACSEDSGVDAHTHSASDINSGLLANARLNMGPGNGLDADTVDGMEASAFLTGAHTHAGADITSGTVANARLNMGSGNGLDADTVDGQEATAFAAASHTHTPPSPILWVGGSSTGDTTTGAYVTYPLDTVTNDTSGGYFTVNAGGTITINTAGYYRISAWTNADVLSTTCNFEGRIQLNATPVFHTQNDAPMGNAGTSITHTHVMRYLGYCSSGDTLNIEYRTQYAGNNFVASGNGLSGATIEYVGP
jgi:hypothetical protein